MNLVNIIGAQHNPGSNVSSGLVFHMQFQQADDGALSLAVVKLPYETFEATPDELESKLLDLLLTGGEEHACDGEVPIEFTLTKFLTRIASDTRRGAGNVIIGEPVFLAAAKSRLGTSRGIKFAECDSVPEKCLILTYIGRERAGDCSPIVVSHEDVGVYGLVAPNVSKYVKVLRWD